MTGDAAVGRDGASAGWSRLAQAPWHPIAFAALIVVSFWLDTAVSPYAAIRSLLVAIAGAGLLTVLLSVLLRSAQRGGIAATALIGLLWSKQLVRLGAGITDRMGTAVALGWLVLLAVAALIAFRLVRRRLPSLSAARLTSALNRVAALLVAATVLLGLLNGRLAGAVGDLDQGIELSSWAASDSADRPTDTPDLYAILLDGYPRADLLEHAFGIDNALFTESLEERGFTVASASHSDYLWTHVSVPSALNLAYVEQIPAMLDVIEGRAPRQPTLRRTIADNEAFRVARDHGYTTIAVASGFEEVAARRADVWVDGGQMNEIEVNLLVSTWLGDLLAVLAPDLASAQQRDRILFNLDVLSDVAAVDAGPRLVLSHVPAPHSPIVFGEGGAPVAVPMREGWYGDSPLERGEDPAEFVDRYRAQLPFLNQRILAAIDAILAASEEPPVIVLFADHGSASRVDWNETEPDEADPARLLERTAILFAALTPGRDDVFPEDASPVDLFRLLYDAYLGTDYGRAVPPADGGHIPPVDAAVLER